MKGQDAPIPAPVVGGDTLKLWEPVAALAKRDDRTWDVKPQGLAKFVTSDASVAIVFTTAIFTVCINGELGYAIMPCIQQPAPIPS